MKTPAQIPLGRYLIGGVPEGFDASQIAQLCVRANGPVLHVARDDVRLAALESALKFFAPELPVLKFPAWDCLPYDRISPNPEVAAARMATLATLAEGYARPVVVLTTVNAATQRVPTRELVRASSFTAVVGDQIDVGELRLYLARMGYSQAPTVSEPGAFAIRGGLIDIFPPGSANPVRLDLFGDVLDAARLFDAMTQRTIEKIGRVEMAPVCEVILDEASIRRFRQNYRLAFGAAGTDDPLYEAVSAGRKHQGFEHWAGFFHEQMATLFDYLPGCPVSMDDQIDVLRQARSEAIHEQYQTRLHALGEKARLGSVYKPAAPELLYLEDDAWKSALKGRAERQFTPHAQPSGPGVLDAGARAGRDFAPERQREGVHLFTALGAHLAEKRKVGNVVIATYSEGARERFKSLLEDEGISGAGLISRFADLPEGKGALALAVWPLESGFEAKGLTVVSEQNVLGERLVRPFNRRKRAENYLTEAASLSPGDLIVHIEHGIGIYRGLETITALGAPHECISLEYSGGDKLFLPVENIELLSRYGQEEGQLDRLGGGAWQAKKAKLKNRIREIAAQLIRIAAERALREGEVLTPPDHVWDEFCARFPYQETDDQLAAIEDVLGDMASGRPMDRLVCGDVGFGKTEVALRAAFVAAMSGVQVAVIAPTTLLSRQHYQNFVERFRGLPVRVRQLSRFVGLKDANQTREDLAAGKVEIVIGTHAILAKGVTFANLGMIVIDEEQKFGVIHKERLKELKAQVHVLTLTATPIPRTLQMALSGVRELSLIGTPPVDRLSIRTYISDFDPVTVREALLREHYRGGQSFYVVPRISDIDEIQQFLRDHVPEVSVVVAHGQMAAHQLDDRMNAFYDGKYDVLLATTIVESGLDIPAANTLIVHRADMYGLAQLYQIRGRVGRSKVRAYAYFTTEPRRAKSPGAEKRLRVLGALDSLGAGFTLASQDLDIRGAGNLLGDEQSGHVREVGYELYQEMLEEAILRLKAGGREEVEVDDTWSPQINLGVPVLIPDTYVPDLDVRLGLYRRLSGLQGKVELEGFAAELIDRFGALPREVSVLMNVMRIKAMCHKAGIARLDAGPKGATVQFHKNKFGNPQGLVGFIQGQRGTASVKDNRIVVRQVWEREGERIKGVYAIAKELAGLVAA